MNNVLKKPWFLIIIISVLTSFVILLAGGVDMSVDIARDIGEKEVESDKKIVMTVNGIDFDYEEFKSMMEQVEWEIMMEGREIVEEEVKEMVIERAIKQAVLISYAKEQGLTPSADEIEERFNEILESYDMSEDEFLELIKNEHKINTRQEINNLLEGEIMIGKLFDRYIEEINISEEEIIDIYEEYIDELKMADVDEDDFPEMEEMREFIKDSIKYEKASEMLMGKAEELKEDAIVELFLDDFDF